MAVRANVLFSDSFDYPDGPIVGATSSPWQTHSGGGTGNQALVVSGQLLLTNHTEDVDAPLEGQPYTVGGGVSLYSSFNVTFTQLPSSSGAYFAHFNAGSYHRCVVWASTSGASAGRFRLGIGNTSGSDATSGQLTNDLVLNTSYTVVTRYDVDSGSSTIWLSPASESSASATAGDAPTSTSVANYSFREASGTGTLFVDDLKVGTAFADVSGSITNEPPPQLQTNTLTLVHYNVKGNGVADWSTNSSQVRAIGRELMYLNPDIVTFNEIPLTNTWQMSHFVNAFLPGYSLATNSGTDGYIRSAIASRFPITRSKSWLNGLDLKAFGYTNSNPYLDNFTRDLFEAEIAVPEFPRPLHVFTTHLKASTDTQSSARRAAEASAISNFFVTVYLAGTNQLDPYVLTGDMNEDVARPPFTSQGPIQRLVSMPTGLHLTTPVNPFNGSELTLSIQSTLDVRFDYIMPCSLLYSNIGSSEVFRTDLLPSPPPPLLSDDDRIASDHLPVVMVFNDPYTKPFRLTSFALSSQTASFQWKTIIGQKYRVEISTNLSNWSVLASNLVGTGAPFDFSTNVVSNARFFRVYAGP